MFSLVVISAERIYAVLCQLLNTRVYEIMKAANAAMTLLEKRPEKIQALNGIRNYDLDVTGAMLYQLSYQSLMRAVVSGPLYSDLYQAGMRLVFD